MHMKCSGLMIVEGWGSGGGTLAPAFLVFVFPALCLFLSY